MVLVKVLVRLVVQWLLLKQLVMWLQESNKWVMKKPCAKKLSKWLL